MPNRNHSTTLLKGLAVLRCFQDGDSDLSMADIARRTGQDRATVRRLCLTLIEAGYLQQGGRALRLAPRVLALAGAFLQTGDIGQTVQPVLNAHADQLGEAIAFVALDGDRAIFVAQSATAGARISMGFTVGSTLPLLPTALGRMLLATLPAPDRLRLIDSLMPEKDSATKLEKSALAVEIDHAAAAGKAVVSGVYEPGICGLAVPVGPAETASFVIGTTLPMALPDFAERCDAAMGVLQSAAATLRRLNALGRW